MKQVAELVPLILFFLAYQMDGETLSLGEYSHTMDGIFSATAVLIAATVIQVLLTWALTRELERRLLWLLAAVCVFGGATLVFRDETFILWKPTVFNWVLAIVFSASHFIGERNLMERTLGSQLDLPKPTWTLLLWLWAGHFTLVGGLNLVVAYGFSEAFWVSYKLYSAFGFTLLLTLVTAFIIAPHMNEEDSADASPADPATGRDQV
ncbi:MAG: inner membrane-spanning protein YciB [Pseudomonadota bacterium]